jgi:hypothetical protein
MSTDPQFNDILLHTSPDGAVKIVVIYEGETFWLSQKKIAQLFGVESNTITYHLKEIYQSGELETVGQPHTFLNNPANISQQLAKAKQ